VLVLVLVIVLVSTAFLTGRARTTTTTRTIRKLRVLPLSFSTLIRISVLQPNVRGYQMVGKRGKPMIFA
jgi:hypothetical protein